MIKTVHFHDGRSDRLPTTSAGAQAAFGFGERFSQFGRRQCGFFRFWDREAGRPDELSKFGDIAFKEGLRNRASFLGDPTKPGAAGNPSKWVVGGAGNSADMVVILAADTCEDLQELQALIAEQADLANFKLIFEQYGNTLPGPLRGHEHFGFKDGISQPGVRGKLSATPGDYITPRYIDHSDGRRLYYSKPGQLLTWPGQYLLGEERQSTEYHDRSAPAATNFPGWARRGSYLVVRRLDQDVGAFWKFVIRTASTVGIPPARFAAMLVGRWPSGAPLMRVPNGDDPDLGDDEFANNHFIFDDDTKPSNLVGLPGYPGDRYPPAKADFLAAVCPHFAHIRKINPRDSVGDLGKPDDNLARMILRRGIPFGRPVAGQENVTDDLLAEERGLMFLCYVGSIEDQFEFLQRRWANSDVQPNFGGHDPIIGQNGSDASRQRRIDFPTEVIGLRGSRPKGGSRRRDFPDLGDARRQGRNSLAGRLGYADGRGLFLRADDLSHPRCPWELLSKVVYGLIMRRRDPGVLHLRI